MSGSGRRWAHDPEPADDIPRMRRRATGWTTRSRAWGGDVTVKSTLTTEGLGYSYAAPQVNTLLYSRRFKRLPGERRRRSWSRTGNTARNPFRGPTGACL